MPSEQENQSQNLEHNMPNQRPLPGSVGRSLQDGNSILDFVQKNTPGYNPAAAEIQKDVDAMAEERGENKVVSAPEPEPVPEPDLTKEEPEPDPDEGPTPGYDEQEREEEEETKGTVAENFKKLRTKLKEVEADSEKKDGLLEEVTKELEAFAKGEKIPEELKKREARMKELEGYEQILNLRKSEYYQDNFVKPLEKIGNRLDRIAKEYNIDPANLRKVANMKSEAEVNRFLSHNFDSVGASDVKNLIRDYRSIQIQAAEAEQEPKKALDRMMAEAAEARSQAQVRSLQKMQDTVKAAWRESLNYIREEGKIRELIHKEGDIEHNDKIYKPIVEAAASEYGKLVKKLVSNGLKELPSDLAMALSRLCQLAHASAVAIDSRERAVSMAEELQANTQRTNRYTRPSVSGKVGAGTSTANGSAPSSPMEAAERILQQVKGR